MSGSYTDGTMELGGVGLHFTEWGEEHEESILCLGGTVQEAHVWDRLAAGLARSYRIVCLDMRGQGDSSWSRDGYFLANFADDLRSFCAKAFHAPYHIIGHSLGARVAIGYAGTQPMKLKSIVLSDFGPGVSREVALRIRGRVADYFRVGGFRTEDEALDYFRSRDPGWEDEFYHGYARHNLRRNWAGRLVPKADPELYYTTTSAVRSDIDYLWGQFAQVRVPVMLAVARKAEEGGRFVGAGDIARMRELVPSMTVREFDTYHFIPLEDPDGFEAAVRLFLSEIDVAAG